MNKLKAVGHAMNLEERAVAGVVVVFDVVASMIMFGLVNWSQSQ